VIDQKDQCCVSVWTEGSYCEHQCSRRGVIERDGKRYCKQHDPMRKKAAEDKRKAAWKAASDASQKAYDRRVACEAACEGVATCELVPGLVARLLADKEIRSD